MGQAWKRKPGRAQVPSSQHPDFKAHCQLPYTREDKELLPTPTILLARAPTTNKKLGLIVTPCQDYSSLPCGPRKVRIPSASESIPLPINKSTPIPARDRGRCKTPGVRERCLAGGAIQ